METQNKNIKYNYYPIDCINIRKINKNSDERIATYQGKINEPNIMYKNGKHYWNKK